MIRKLRMQLTWKQEYEDLQPGFYYRTDYTG